MQRRWTKQVDGLSQMDYASRLRTLNLYSISGRLLRSDLVKVWKAFHPVVDVDMRDLFELRYDDRTRGHSFKLSIPRCNTELKRQFLSTRCVQAWNNLPADVVECECFRTFKRALDEELGDRLYMVV